MSASFTSSAANAGASPLTITSAAIPDDSIVYVIAHTGGAGSDPISPPAGWTTLDTGTWADGARYGLFRKVAASIGTSHVFTSAGASVVALMYWYSSGNVSQPEDVAVTKTASVASETANPGVPSITTVTANALHVILSTVRDFAASGGAFPAGYTVRASDGDTNRGADKVIASASTVSGLSIAESHQFFTTYSIAIRDVAASTGPNITSVSSATPREGASLTITGTSFGASQGSGDVKINGVAQTVTSWADTSITVTIVLGTNKFGAAYTVVVRDTSLNSSNSYAGITGLLPANSGLSYIDLGTPNATSAYRITAVGDLASGDQLEYENKGGGVTVNTDGTFSLSAAVSSFSCRLWSTGVGYGTSGSQNTSGLTGDRRYLKLSPNIKLGW